MKKDRFIPFACLFVVMTGFGITLTVLPFCAQRIALAEGASPDAATVPVAAAYIADTSTLEERSMALGRMNAATSLGVVFGPVLGGMLTRTDLHFEFLLALCRRIHVWRLGTVPSLTREEPSLWVSVAL
jgi:DHA1 family multidrug resistance protein-like MFS transporter